jgi:O-succinylbenzoate synthase
MSEEMEIYILREEIDELRARAERAEADAERLAEVLRRFEWSFRSRIFGLVCPECANDSSDKHAADCSIGTAIAAHEALKEKGGE